MTDELNYEELEADYRKKCEEDGQKVPNEISKTQLWYWSVERQAFRPNLPKGRKFMMCDEPRISFHSTPPLNELSKSNRLLVVTTNYEGRFLDELVNKFRETPAAQWVLCRATEELANKADPDLLAKVEAADALLGRIGKGQEYQGCSRMADFWSKFFGVEKFMDTPEAATKPAGILTTGFMRTYGCQGGCTDSVEVRLKQIGEHFEIEVKMIPTFAP